MDSNIKLGNNLRYYRKQSGLTLKEMAARIDISFATYQKYETGQIKHVDIDTVSKFALALGVTPESLLDWDEKEESPETTKEALKLFELYEKADPTVKIAIDTLLKKNKED